MRRDALVAAAEMIVEIERIARTSREVVATVGCADVLGGAVNVIPSLVRFTIDVRSATDASRDNSVDEIIRAIHQIAKRRHVGLKVAPTHEASAVACSPAVIAGLLRAIRRQGIVGRTLASGAGHDAMAMATLCPIGMLFVRCAGGISHNPAESISVDDAEVCVRVLLEYLFTLDPAKLRQAASH
jgi:hydantoinase/carbamoylase family amidase